MPTEALALITLCWAAAAVACLTIAVPQGWLLVRTSLRRDPLWWFRLKSVLLFGSLAVAMLRNVVVWADYTFFEQRYLGTIDVRWRMDLILATLIMLACILASALYVQTHYEKDSDR